MTDKEGYRIAGNTITLSNGYSIDFEYAIKEILKVDDVIVITLACPLGIRNNQNVFAFSLQGDFLWRIKETSLLGADINRLDGYDCPYVSAVLNNDRELVLFNWCDTAVIVNPLTGDVIRKYQTK